MEERLDSKKIFSYNLARLLKQSGMTRANFQSAMGNVNKSSVSLWLSGKRTPSDALKERIAQVFNIPLSDLFLSPNYIEAKESDPFVQLTVLGSTQDLPEFAKNVEKFCAHKSLRPFGLLVVGDVLEPYLRNGDCAECKMVKGVSSPQYVLVQEKGSFSLCVLSRPERLGGMLVLTSTNNVPQVLHNTPEEIAENGILCIVCGVHRALHP